MAHDTFRRLKVAILGNCQVTGLAATARALMPGAEVVSWHIGVNPKDSDEEVLARLVGFDSVISQISDWNGHSLLHFAQLRDRGLPVVYLPALVFPGFHPDITHIRGPNGFVPGLPTHHHSLIVVAAFMLGLPASRVPDLFNAFVFADLGYFDVFDAARTALFDIFYREDIDLAPLFDRWMEQAGPFMYTYDHPHILALATLCRIMLARAGLIDLATPLPEHIDDYLASSFIWPMYPALASRIGLSGSTTFLASAHGLAPGLTRELPLADYVSACFDSYGKLEKGALHAGNVDIACERLSESVVR